MNKTKYIFRKPTKLRDDKGNLIHEGDIVEIHNMIETKIPYISEVIFINDTPYIRPHPAHKSIGIDEYRELESFCDYGYGGMYNVRCKIVGNVYENKYLLERIK